MTVGIVMTVWKTKTAHRGTVITMPTVVTLLPTLCDISILHASASRCGGPNGVASSASTWSRRALRDLYRTKTCTDLCTEL